MNLTLFKILNTTIKYTAALGLVGMILQVILLLFNINTPWIDWIFGFSVIGFIMLFISSYALLLCSLFRKLLIYDFIVHQFILWQKESTIFGTGLILNLARWITLIVGLYLLIILIYKLINKQISL